MVIDLTDAFVGDCQKVLRHNVDLSDLDFNGVHAIEKPVEAVVKILSHAGVVDISLSVKFTYSALCDRCAAPVEREYSFVLERTLVREFSGDDFDDDRYILVEDAKLDIDELVNSEVILSLPSKFLCRDDCKGLCVQCGKNLNEGKCSCSQSKIDPRLEALKELLD